MNSSSSGRKSDGFFAGKGFYIVLFLCAAVIGASAWMVAADSRAVKSGEKSSVVYEGRRIETVVVTPEVGAVFNEDPGEAPAISTEEPAINTEETVTASTEGTVSLDFYVWPVNGELERGYTAEALAYDVTMRDWRTHEGIDILAQLGTPVAAAHAGTVESVVHDDLYGTTVTVLNSDGVYCTYSNLAETPTVSAGDWVEPGTVIGAVGDTALCEIGQGTHLHLTMSADGVCVDPLRYLPC